MHRLSALSCRAGLLAAAAALSAPLAAPLAAQAQPGPFTLPQSTPTPTPAPAGPADERAGVAIPPRAVPSPVPSPVPSVTPPPVIQPLPSPSPQASPRATPAATPTPAPARTPAPQDAAPVSGTNAPTTPDVAGTPPAPAIAPPLTLPGADQAPTLPGSAGADLVTDDSEAAWWPYAAGALGALGLLLGGVWVWRQRQPAARRLAAPVPGRSASGVADAGVSAIPHDPAQLNLTLEIISATRSVMMFTVAYRLTIANRSDRAVNDLGAAVQLACARADSAGNAPSPGATQATDRIARIGPHQARSMTGELRLPLAAIQPLRQGKTPLFVPLAHVTLEGEGLPAMHRSFVIGTSSSAGRVHPIPLDQPPGGIAGLVARAISIAPASAPAPVAA